MVSENQGNSIGHLIRGVVIVQDISLSQPLLVAYRRDSNLHDIFVRPSDSRQLSSQAGERPGPKRLKRNSDHKTARLFIIFCWTNPILAAGYQIPCQCKLPFGFQSLARFWIPRAELRIPVNAQDSGFQKQIFPNSGIWITARKAK